MTPTSAGQDPGTSGPARGPAPAGLIWTRPPKEHRERPAREAIVASATALAGTRGLGAVSIRRVAAALQTRPIDLYCDGTP
jgi:AcrR family transcriptional regulator